MAPSPGLSAGIKWNGQRTLILSQATCACSSGSPGADKGARHAPAREDAHDYRHFPGPDLLPLEIDAAWIELGRRARAAGTAGGHAGAPGVAHGYVRLL
ncbi:hypothetical protein ACU4GD_09145 [Cupriavidus basilensis]